MPEYFVKWEIEVTADSLQEAANLALEIQRDPYSEAINFIVQKLPLEGKEHIDYINAEIE